MNKQREVIYSERRRVLEGENLRDEIQDMMSDVLNNVVAMYTVESQFPEEWKWDELFLSVSQVFPLGWGKESIDTTKITQEELVEKLVEAAQQKYADREKEFGEEIMRDIERFVMLEVIDSKWREHLYEMDYLKEGIGLRAIGQRDPLIEYKTEGYDMFQSMIESIKEDVLRYAFHVQVVQDEQVARPKQEVIMSSASSESAPKKPVKNTDTIGRNDPCPCGSGKKYKKCCGGK
jgi:preprotein translocase subunit SecA